MSSTKDITFGIIIVSYSYSESTFALAKQVLRQKDPRDFLIVVDNHPTHTTEPLLSKLKGIDKVIKTENNGFSRGINEAARDLPNTVNTILVINPDVVLGDDSLQKMRRDVPDNWAAWMGLVKLPDDRINSAGNTIHLSGLSWCRDLGESSVNFKHSQEISMLSGAYFAVRIKDWEELGGMPESYFLYYEDTEFSFRLKMQGKRIGLKPDAVAFHDYSFEKGNYKWFYLERNRQLFIFRNYPFMIILALSPLLFSIDIGLLCLAIIQGRGLTKLKSNGSFLKMAVRSFPARHHIQKERKISLRQVIDLFDVSVGGVQLKKFSFINPLTKVYVRFLKLIFR